MQKIWKKGTIPGATGGVFLAFARILYRMAIGMALKTKVKEYREKAGIKQSELAELVHVRRETIVHLENGKYNPSLKLAMDIAKVFQVAVEELFAFTED